MKVSRSKWDHEEAKGALFLTREHLMLREVLHDKTYRKANFPSIAKKELHASSNMSGYD